MRFHPAYVAGFLDGEGSIGFGKRRSGGIFPRVLIVNTDLEILEQLRARYGGDIKKLSARKENWRQGFMWRISWTRAVEFIDAINPWLRLKAEQANIIMAWDAIRLGQGNARYPSSALKEYRETCAFLFERMRWLNARGPKIGPDPLDAVLAEARAST